MTVSKDLLKDLRAEINAALVPIAQKFNLQRLQAGNATFNATRFSIKLEGEAQGAKSEDQERYELLGATLGLPPIGTKLTYNRQDYETCGLPARGGSVLIKRLSDGRQYKLDAGTVIALIKAAAK